MLAVAQKEGKQLEKDHPAQKRLTDETDLGCSASYKKGPSMNWRDKVPPRIVHSSLSDFAPGLARDEEFPLFPTKLGIVTRFRDSHLGLVAIVETQRPSLTSTTRGEIVLCSEAETITLAKTHELIKRCRDLARELTAQADRLRARISSEMLQVASVDASTFAKTLDEDPGRVYETRAATLAKEPHSRAARAAEPRENSTAASVSASVSRASRPRVDQDELDAILADED